MCGKLDACIPCQCFKVSTSLSQKSEQFSVCTGLLRTVSQFIIALEVSWIQAHWLLKLGVLEPRLSDVGLKSYST